MTVSQNTELDPSALTTLGSPGGPILRQYSAPTCKLEISANPSALSHWARKLALKNQRFLLKFEDPRVSEDQWTTLRGDRLKLEALTEVVATYVQTFLSQSKNLERSEDSNDLTGILLPQFPNQTIFLQPKGLLSHTLHLGPIVSDLSESTITLSSTQLADLASVLDEHSSETLAIPTLNRDRAWMRSPVAWGKIAALSLLSVGVTATVLRQFDPKPTPSLIASQASDQRLTPPSLPQPTPTTPILLQPNILPGIQPGAIAVNPYSLPTPNSVTVDKKISSTSTAPPSTNPQDNKLSIPVAPQPDGAKPRGTQSPKNASPAAQRQSRDQSLMRKGESSPLNPASAPIAPITGSKPFSDVKSRADNDPTPPLDLTIQIGAIQSKVPTKWTPPEKFSEDLKYLMEVSAAGTVISVIPEGQGLPVAEAIVPKKGEIIAPVVTKNSQPYKVRIFFYANGEVSVKRAY
ncbi:MAG: DUF4335 domain-containing protein [Cyanobacteria bacterium]|nr:DUF4335 domain-containing protein [Cyanobacteriota bacterium]